MGLKIRRTVVREGYDRKSCFVHARAGLLPGGGDPFGLVLTMSKMRLEKGKSDLFEAIHDLASDDGGRSWTGPRENSATLGPRPADGGVETVCDFWPGWHAASKTLLGTGHNCLYQNDGRIDPWRRRSTAYSVYDPATRTWADWEKLAKPESDLSFNEGAGCTQRVDLPDGDILLPVYYLPDAGDRAPGRPATYRSTVLRCRFDGRRLEYAGRGDALGLPTGRGLYEPSLTAFAGRYFLTLRNDDDGYVAVGDDGTHFGPVQPWRFDDGRGLGNYNTQQHWAVVGGRLYLVYTRRGADNDHVFRHRAPLFIGEVDPRRLCVIRASERILVPEHGARLGNFGVTRIDDEKSLVTVTEWMQSSANDPADCERMERLGSNNRLFIVEIAAD